MWINNSVCQRSWGTLGFYSWPLCNYRSKYSEFGSVHRFCGTIHNIWSDSGRSVVQRTSNLTLNWIILITDVNIMIISLRNRKKKKQNQERENSDFHITLLLGCLRRSKSNRVKKRKSIINCTMRVNGSPAFASNHQNCAICEKRSLRD